MSKLDDILEPTRYTDWETEGSADEIKQQIKDLMLELIAELRDATPAVNRYADDLSDKVKEL